MVGSEEEPTIAAKGLERHAVCTAVKPSLPPGPGRPPPGVDIHNLSDGLAIGCGRYAARRLGMNRSSGVVSAVGAAGAGRFFSIWASSHVLAAAAARSCSA
jgi:hypothetical protein